MRALVVLALMIAVGTAQADEELDPNAFQCFSVTLVNAHNETACFRDLGECQYIRDVIAKHPYPQTVSRGCFAEPKAACYIYRTTVSDQVLPDCKSLMSACKARQKDLNKDDGKILKSCKPYALPDLRKVLAKVQKRGK